MLLVLLSTLRFAVYWSLPYTDLHFALHYHIPVTTHHLTLYYFWQHFNHISLEYATHHFTPSYYSQCLNTTLLLTTLHFTLYYYSPCVTSQFTLFYIPFHFTYYTTTPHTSLRVLSPHFTASFIQFTPYHTTTHTISLHPTLPTLTYTTTLYYPVSTLQNALLFITLHFKLYYRLPLNASHFTLSHRSSPHFTTHNTTTGHTCQPLALSSPPPPNLSV